MRVSDILRFNKQSLHVSHSGHTMTIIIDYGETVPHLQFLQVRPLHTDHRSQYLVPHTIPGQGEVNQGALGLQLRLAVGAGKISVEEPSEAGVVLTLLVLYLNVPAER